MRVHVGLPLLATHPISPPPESGENRNSVELPADRKSGPETPEVLPDRFCQECKIQFSSVSTYQVHKQHYCRIRNFTASSGRPASSASSAQPRTKTPIMDPSIPRLILPTQPPIAIPLCIAQAAKILTPEDPLPPHAIIVSPEGELQFQRETLRESFPAPETLLREEEEENSAASSSAEVQPEPEEVLDLSSKPADLKRVKEPSPGTLRIREELARVQPNPQIPSIPFLPPKVFAELEALGMCLGVPSGHEMASNPAQWLSMLETAVLTATSPTLVPSPAAAAAPPVAKPATIPCEDCNISFRRMESYLVHRQFYCAARQREKSESANSNRTESNADEEPNPNREKLLPHKPPKIPCDQCGIEFESANTLQAHKTYYCLKGNAADSVSVSSNEEPEKTTQSENTTAAIKVEENVVSVENNSATTPTTVVQRPDSNSPSAAAQSSAGLLPQGPGWKCPCCDLVSPTAAAAQKHIETHSNVRAFRCSLCGYRGNTLRGMRTHVRIHFDRRITDQCEDNYISCILSPEGPQTTTSAVSPGPGSSSDLEQLCRSLGIRPEICSKILSSSPETSAAMLALGKLTNDGSNPSLAALQFLQLAQRMSSHSPGPTTGAGCRSDKLFLCDLCCYSSSYRGNVIRHSKLVHGREINDVAVVASNFLQATKPNMADQQQSARIPPLPLEKLVVPVSPVPQQTPRLSALPVERLVVPVSPPLEALTPPLKKEPVDAAPDSPTAGDSNENMQKHCKSCNITFNYMSTYLAHKKYYCSSHAAEAAAAPAEPTHA